MPGVEVALVDLEDLTVARTVHEPGWRWSTHIKPDVGGEWCQVRHVGVVLTGQLGLSLPDGTTLELGPDDAYDIPPGHDGYVIGHEPLVVIEWAGVRAFLGFLGGTHNRLLATLMFTDLVASSATARKLGDAAWRAKLSAHFEGVRAALERHRGTEVKTTGDGVLATFSAPAQALACASEIRRAAHRDGLDLRVGVHVGEVELVGRDVRGVAVHEAQRIMDLAGDGEVWVSETTRALAMSVRGGFDDRGEHVLAGLPGTWRLYAYIEDAAPHS